MTLYHLEDYQAYDLSFIDSLIKKNSASTIHFIWPSSLMSALGPDYWKKQEEIIMINHSNKILLFWYDYSGYPGYILGALRAGCLHLIYEGEELIFKKLQDCAAYYQARIVRSMSEILMS